MQMYHLVVQYRMTERCASIRNVNFPLPSPNFPNDRPIQAERDRAVQSGTSDMLEAAVQELIAAIEEDGADTIILGCSAAFWMQPLLQKRLLEIGWDVPVLEGARCGHRGRQDAGRSRRRRQRARLSRRTPGEVAAPEDVLAVPILHALGAQEGKS